MARDNGGPPHDLPAPAPEPIANLNPAERMVTQTPREIPGVPVPLIPAFAVGPKGGALELKELDGSENPACRPIHAPPGSMVVIIPPPASEHLARAMGLVGPNGMIRTVRH